MTKGVEADVLICTDGGSRGNPGPAAIGGVISFDGEKKTFSENIGRATNNDAEYEALIFALKKAKSFLGKKKAKQAELKCFTDSELMAKQLNHEYKLREERIQRYFIEIWNLSLDFKRVEFFHIRREKNKEADALVNKALDEDKSRLF